MSGMNLFGSLPASRTLTTPAISRHQIDTALAAAHLRRRAERGELLAVAAVTGIDPADLYAEALMFAELEGARR